MDIKKKLKQLFISLFAAAMVITPVTAHGFEIREHVYADGEDRGYNNVGITHFNKIEWNSNTWTSNNNYNGIKAPLKVYNQASATNLNGSEHFFYGRLWWDNQDGGSIIDRSNTLYYISSSYNNNVITNGYYLSNDYDQFYLKKFNGGAATSGDFEFIGGYSRTSTTVNKVYNNSIGNSPSSSVTQQWGTTTPLPDPTMNTYTINLNLMDGSGTKASCSKSYINYKYIYDGMSATVTGGYNSDQDTTGVFASSQGLSGFVSNEHAQTIYYYGVKGTLSIPAIAKEQGDIGPDPTSCTFTAYYSRDAIALPTPTRPGYTFDGWYLNSAYSGTKYNGGSSYFSVTSTTAPNASYPAGSFTLYAKWTPIKYNVNFDLNAPKDYNGNSRIEQITNKPSNTTVTFDNVFRVSTPSLKGYKFNGWYISNMTTNSKVAKKHGVNNPPENTFNYNLSTGYFSCSSASSTTYLNLQDKNNSTAYFKSRTGNSPDGPGWTPINYNIILDPNSGSMNINDNTYSSTVNISATYDKGITLPVVTRKGYEFLGWQVYSISGKSDYDYMTNTNTDPMTSSPHLFRGNNTAYNLCYTQGSSIKLVAIWNHAHSEPNIKDITLDKANPYIYYTNNDPTGFSDVCYYINTNYDNIKNMEFGSFTCPSSDWYRVVSYGIKAKNKSPGVKNIPEQTNMTMITQINTTFPYITKSDGKMKLSITDNEWANIEPSVNVKCTWHDNYSKCKDYDKIKTYTGNKVTIIGDCEKPTLDEIEKLEDLTAIDLREVDEYIVSLKAKDNLNPSKSGKTVYYSAGIKTSEFKIINSDNYTNMVLSGIKKSKNGIITAIDYDPFDLAVRHDKDETDTDDNLFNGTCEYTYFYVDNVGNIYTNTDNTSVFYLETNLESFTYTPTNMSKANKLQAKHNETIRDKVPSFKKGEAALLEVTTMGYADAIKLEFPKSWYIDEDYPLYMYYGDTSQYEEDKLIPISSDVFYLDTAGKADENGYWTENFVFILPLYADQTELADVKITAYKGDGISVSENHDSIKVNHDGITGDDTLETLSDIQYFEVNDKSILNDFRDSIKQTYRAPIKNSKLK